MAQFTQKTHYSDLVCRHWNQVRTVRFNEKVIFKLDTGAHCNVLSANVLKALNVRSISQA